VQTAQAYRNPLIQRIVRFAIATGMRRGEILAMKWQHINLADRSLLIPLTKTGHSRIIPLANEAVKVLSGESQNGDFVFPIKGNAFQLAWGRITTRAKIDDLRFHDLRHEAISRFFETRRNERIALLFSIIERHVSLGVSSAVHHEMYESIFRGRLPPKADSTRTSRHVREVPLSDFRLPFVESHLSALSRLHSL
jgi:integrase